MSEERSRALWMGKIGAVSTLSGTARAWVDVASVTSLFNTKTMRCSVDAPHPVLSLTHTHLVTGVLCWALTFSVRVVPAQCSAVYDPTRDDETARLTGAVSA